MVGVERRGVREVERQRAEALYAWDVQFGRIMKTLKKTGQYDDTVVVFTSDNGYFLGEHRQRTGKIKPHEPSLRVPLVVAGPGIPHGVRYAPITTIDLTATIIDLAGASPLPAQDGRSAVPAFDEGPAVDGAGGHRGAAAPATTTSVASRPGSPRWGCAPGGTRSSATPPARASCTTCSPTRSSCGHATTTRRTPRSATTSTASGASTASAPPTPAGYLCPPEYVESDRALARQVAKDERARARYYG